MVKDPANASQYLIKNLGTEPLQGTFTLYYDDTSDVRKTVTGAQWNIVSYIPDNQLAAGATITVPAFTPPTDAKAANTYMLVFKGKIGADIGNPAATDSLAAKTVTNIRVKQLALGESHTCALIVDGAVYCWGSNSSGQLGNGETVNSATPVSVLGIGTATSVAAGFEFACATLADGAVKCWGYNANGQLGNGITGDYFSYSTPVSVLDIGAVTSVAAATHSCATLAEGGVKCWGFNSFGQLGNGTSVHSSTPVSVPGIGTATTVAAGSENTCATLADGAVKCWGLNLFGELGNGVSTVDAYGNWITPWLYSSTPVSVLGIGTATSVGVGYHHACASLADGAVKCWGSQLSNGTTVNSPTPVSVVGIGTATSVAAGASHSCAILADGTVKCWGLNSYGELGNGTTTDSSIPVTVIGLPGSP